MSSCPFAFSLSLQSLCKAFGNLWTRCMVKSRLFWIICDVPYTYAWQDARSASARTQWSRTPWSAHGRLSAWWSGCKARNGGSCSWTRSSSSQPRCSDVCFPPSRPTANWVWLLPWSERMTRSLTSTSLLGLSYTRPTGWSCKPEDSLPKSSVLKWAFAWNKFHCLLCWAILLWHLFASVGLVPHVTWFLPGIPHHTDKEADGMFCLEYTSHRWLFFLLIFFLLLPVVICDEP